MQTISRRTLLGSAAAIVGTSQARAWLVHGTGAGGGSPSVPYVIPGTITSTDTIVASSWSADTYSTPQGTSGQEGYAYAPAGANWACERFQECVTGNDVWIGVVAAGTPDLTSYAANDVSCNLLKVSLAIGGGAYTDQTALSAHPVTGKVAFWFKVRVADVSGASGLYEVRARCIPKVGQPFLLQGLDPTGLATLAAQSAFSNWVILDKGDLARQTIYKAPNDGTAQSSDAHAGTSGDPCVTWKRVRDLQRAHASYPNVLTQIYLTASINHEWGYTGAEDTPVESRLGWTRIQPAPGLTNANVSLTRFASGSASTTYNIPWRKFYLKDVNFGDIRIYNRVGTDQTVTDPGSRGGDGYYNNTTLGIDSAFHTHCENIITTARSFTLDNSGGTNQGQPTNDIWFEHGDHSLTVEFINCQIQYAATTSFYQTTYGRDCWINHINNIGDMADNMRYFANLRAYNCITGNQLNHLDFLQPTLPAQGSGSDGQCAPAWLEDCVNTTADGNSGMQGILADSGHGYANSVILRGVFHTGTANDLAYTSALKNDRFIACDTGGSGAVPGWDYQNGAAASLHSPCANTWFLHYNSGTGANNFEITYRKGVKHLYPFSTRIPNPGLAIPVSTLKTAINGAAQVAAIWDLDVDEFVMRIHRDDTWPSPNFLPAGTTKVRGLIDANWPEAESTLNIQNLNNGTPIIYAQGSQPQQGTASRRPTTVEGIHRKAAFTSGAQTTLSGAIPHYAQFVGAIDASGVLTVSEISSLGTPLAAGQALFDAGPLGRGTTITSQLSGTTGGVGTYQLSATGGNGQTYVMSTAPLQSDPMTIFMALDIKSDTSTSEGYFLNVGGADVGTVYIGRNYISGKQRIVFHAGQSQAAGANAASLYGDTGSGAPAIEGPTVICFEIKSDRLTLTFWNAATGSGGYSVDVLYTSGYQPYHQMLVYESLGIGGYGSVAAANATFDLNSITISALLGATPKAAVLADMKARMGIS